MTNAEIHRYGFFMALDASEQATKEDGLNVGQWVGHMDRATYGQKAGTIKKIGGDGTVTVDIRQDDGSDVEAVWPIEGIIDINTHLDEQAMADMMIAAFLNNGSRVGGKDLPTPNCDCDHCKEFTPEQHEEAARVEAQERAELEASQVDLKAPTNLIPLLAEFRTQKAEALAKKAAAREAAATEALEAEAMTAGGGAGSAPVTN